MPHVLVVDQGTPGGGLVTKPGIWKHFRGGLYRVLLTGRNSTNGPDEGREVVCYVSLTTGKVNFRDEQQFHQRVHADGTVCRPDCPAHMFEGHAYDRFQWQGEHLGPAAH